ncbi:aminotransferase class V-fold PLP-dependent enzyme [Blastopirellula sp. JC732]|uniref:Aminotransferase class V-fold PLP-dependent enzyme n=1 Tax=Blastopirellula sediminis TaxID=2894196 RepID=A0A9X1MRD6_9BACT|nr:aminotransferase class V-fold PLP-dependent enzyme [Blastopirellula sediminis]MCC9605224.1 aminotransferase class V-fold PLP-dependent enzyme [Blastopirellula sediminis]MCC9631476.1 aminotransferase class V-fold PLP-dependent enzyme [Blastopirellula sediminis]
MSQPTPWDQFRQEMTIAPEWAYFDHSSVSPLPRRTADLIRRFVDQAAAGGNLHWPEWATTVEKTRGQIAALVNADIEEIALLPNTTHGVSLVAGGYAWKPGDSIVVLSNEFPANLYPWMHLESVGVEVRQVQVEGAGPTLDQIAAAIDSTTKIVAVSWVSYSTGYRLDIAKLTELAHSRGALLFVDVIQGLGVFPFDVKATGVDFFASTSQKWMMSPEGAGMFYIRREHFDKLRPLFVGPSSMVKPYDYDRIALDFADSARRFEGGSKNMVGYMAMGSSLGLLMEYGAGPQQSAIGERVLEIGDYAVERLQSIGASIFSDREGEKRSGIISFDFPGQDPHQLRKRCVDAKVALSVRSGRLRISPHAYTDQEDVDRLIAALS